MFRYGSLALCLMLGTATLEAQSGNENKEEARLANAGVVMQEILDVPENIPQDLLVKAECGKRIAVPAAGRHLVDVLDKHASRNQSIGTTGR